MTGPEKLRRLAQDIAGLMEQEALLEPTARTIAPELGEWFVAAIERFTSGQEPDLEKALGIIPRRGRPRQGREAKNYKRARKVFDWLRGAGGKPALTMDEILAKLPNANKVDLEDEQDRYHAELCADLAEEVAAKINALSFAKRS
jgi:hypothetical protein